MVVLWRVFIISSLDAHLEDHPRIWIRGFSIHGDHLYNPRDLGQTFPKGPNDSWLKYMGIRSEPLTTNGMILQGVEVSNPILKGTKTNHHGC